ncbi:MAG: hypothetical protein Satyrvirus6_4 [Satyrvirus sp.]|uniref:Uncharacterized protein n=1 Tax=Satyrvirus sp. TaxID=2487771 RepID=A0A3G5ADB5_9VIRU|nr:MAG: hypothetical protein Satyrvirus6_4 [Satyrvirus sp.]
MANVFIGREYRHCPIAIVVVVPVVDKDLDELVGVHIPGGEFNVVPELCNVTN